MTWSALILAGSRPGTTDPVATYAGVSHKALIRLEGATLLDRVAAAVRAAGATRVAVSASDRAVVVEAMRLGLEVLPPAAGPSASVAAALTVLGTPLLVTTADHALLDGAWIARFLADVPAEADVATLLARRDVVEAVPPRPGAPGCASPMAIGRGAICSGSPRRKPRWRSACGARWKRTASGHGGSSGGWGRCCCCAICSAG